jgi:predicted PhzF superfamily epimerase YddE/YHI9
VTTLHVVKVFVGPDGRGGNPLGVFLDGAAVPADRRQAVAADLGFSETVFVEPGTTRVRIYTPALELPFAGHPLVGTSWLLAQREKPAEVLVTPAGDVPTWVDEAGRHWIRGQADWAPAMELRQFGDPAEIDALTDPPDPDGFVDAWAWQDEARGEVRARVFAPSHGVPEDEATGSAAVRLVTSLGRPITVRQGVGSVLYARPGPAGTADVGGTTILVDERPYRL